MSGDLVAHWTVPLPDGKHEIEFEHGTTSGKRVIRLDKKEVHRVEWMFKLVGKEQFKIGKHNCVISIDACSGFAYEYTLEVDGKPYKKFTENQNKIQKCWRYPISGPSLYRIVLEKTTMNVWVNGKLVESFGAFGDDDDDDGDTKTHFQLSNDHSGIITSASSGTKRGGMVFRLFINEQEIPESKD